MIYGEELYTICQKVQFGRKITVKGQPYWSVQEASRGNICLAFRIGGGAQIFNTVDPEEIIPITSPIEIVIADQEDGY